MKLPPFLLPAATRLLSLYPPYLGAGIVVTRVSADMTELEVEMRLRPWTRNAVGTHFGGSLYSMVDPFFMLLLMAQLGPGYIVWDKAAAIDFRKPGRGRVRARFCVPRARTAEIKQLADTQRKTEPLFHVEVRDEQDDVVASVEKRLYVRRVLRPAGAVAT